MTHCWPGAFENSKGLLIDFMKGEGLVITCNHHCRIVSLQGLVKRFFSGSFDGSQDRRFVSHSLQAVLAPKVPELVIQVDST